MVDEKIVEDLAAQIKAIQGTKTFIDKLYYDPAFSSFFNRPVLSMLMAGCDYLSSNLDILRSKYITANQ